MILYHGSDKIIQFPEIGKGIKYNDYGQGFYTTESMEMASEWASKEISGFVNRYELSADDLVITDLNNYGIMAWLAVLLHNRKVNFRYREAKEAQDYIVKNFLPDLSESDVIMGYRADDSYFTFARDFVTNQINVSTLSKAMNLGDLGIQYCIKSEKAFRKLEFIDFITVNFSEYHSKFMMRDQRARRLYYEYREETSSGDGLFIRDIIRKGMTSNDKFI